MLLLPLDSVFSLDGARNENIRSFLTEMSKAVGTKHRTLILGSAIAQCESFNIVKYWYSQEGHRE